MRHILAILSVYITKRYYHLDKPNMKKTITTILLALFTLTGWAQVKCHIEGELLAKSQGVTVIVCPANMDLRVSDDYVTAKADDHGHFSCDVTADKMMLYKALLEEQYSTGCWSSAEFLVENNATVKLSYNHDKWKVLSGGPEQMLKVQMDAEADRLFHRMNEISQEGEEKLMPLVEKLQKEGIDPKTDTVLVNRMKALEAEYNVLFKQYKDWELEYYKKHPMLYMLYDIADYMQYQSSHKDEQNQQMMDMYHSIFENFHPEDPIHGTIRSLEGAWKMKPGKSYIDYDVLSVAGEKINLASLYKGKVALIDLWASWCGPCRRHSKDMIPIYEKYKDQGFTVVSIAREDKVDRMLHAAKQDGYPWESYVDIKDELNVWQKNGLSFSGGGMFLIDRNGKILSNSTDVDEIEPLIRKELGLPQLPPSGWQAEALKNRVEKDDSKPFTDFSVVYNGKTTRLSDYVGKGRYVLVDFWASWCGPCKAEIPNLIAAYNKYKGKGLQLLGVAVKDKPAHSEATIKEMHIPYPQIINAQMVPYEAYQLNGIPHIILFAPDGTIVARGLRGEDIDKKLAEIFAE